ncbi:maleylpyruvate isomerase family mycothiol-dependent enzyme [Actinacidiphila sp. ITFR-21]|uniref:maleylpyruvate isomerase family mycothiol-dependent enzyme n=1 Tax=Actinacidiphila sp. ITFR-21 TaxID=3075199 RepID=UPI00288AB83E|nr:maleylpyruvate isomerase family mycothiol-dependent enzyme [Streptomyces sp. ITFR-21]WNI19305.1 maleylpyruvate isomerase family mycothiol-dependent enzyme [Streptomyces sp. ITFR-21]
MAVTPDIVTPADLRLALDAGHLRLRELLGGLTQEAARAPSALPGWTRGHVLSHIEGVGLALARQARYALRGRLIEVYDGGRAGRNAAIEAGQRRGAPRLRAALADALDEIEASWSAVGPDDWGRPVRYRDGTLFDAGLAWWRELEIHTADALLGRGVADWSEPFCAHLVEFLAPRVPVGVELSLTAVDGPWSWTRGTGTPVAVRGRLTDLAAWLAGRHPVGPLTGDPLPDLEPWP